MRLHLNCSTTISAVIALLAVVSWPVAASAQVGQQGQAGRQNNQAAASRQPAASPTANLQYDPHDLSGVWIFHGPGGFSLSNEAPPMTPWAQAKYNANKPGIGRADRIVPLGNDPIMRCDPIGYPRILFYGAYPVEIVQTPNRVIQFFDFFYTHRVIWTDGRDLPKDPEPTWYGYATGQWDGDTLVVRSSGFNDKPWVDADGHPHSDEMQLEERYKRVDHDTISISMTLTDPKAYTKPWVSAPMTLKWSPKEVMREDVCAPSDEEKYKEEVRDPAGHKGG
jgi:hypothetical protein